MATRNTYYLDGANLLSATAAYSDIQLTTKAADGFYSDGTNVREQVSGLFLPPTVCPSCATPCGSGVSATFSGTGWFDANIELGGTPSDIGAVIIYFYMGTSIPDGAVAFYDNNPYNILTSQNNTTTPYGRINNSGTSLPTYVGGVDPFSGSPYTGVPEYNLVAGTYQPLGTTRTITVSPLQNDTRGADTFTMVIPKYSSEPTQLNLQIFAPLTGTVFRWEVLCPTALPSFSSSVGQATTTCAAATQQYYFARNATGTTPPFTVDVNTYPKVGNFVYSDQNGRYPLNDTATSVFYIMDNNNYIEVQYGMVISVGACT